MHAAISKYSCLRGLAVVTLSYIVIVTDKFQKRLSTYGKEQIRMPVYY